MNISLRFNIEKKGISVPLKSGIDIKRKGKRGGKGKRIKSNSEEGREESGEGKRERERDTENLMGGERIPAHENLEFIDRIPGHSCAEGTRNPTAVPACYSLSEESKTFIQIYI